MGTVTSSEDSAVLAQATEAVFSSAVLAQAIEAVLKVVMRVEAGKKTTELTLLRELKEAVTEVKEAVTALTLFWTKVLMEEKEVKLVSTSSEVEAPAATEPVTTGSNDDEETNWAEAQAAIASSASVKRTVVRIVNRDLCKTTE